LRISVAVGAVMLAPLVASAPAVPVNEAAPVAICGQVKNGPRAEWAFPASVAQMLGISRVVKGTTWTVLADGVSCTFAMKRTPALLKQWAGKKPGARLRPGLAGWVCAVDKGFTASGGAGSPGGSCLNGKGGLITFIGSGTYTLAQVKQLAAAGQLPGGQG
jgi:hypothetical protein